MPGFFQEAYNIIVHGGSFQSTEIQYAPNVTFNLFLFPTMGGTLPTTIIWLHAFMVVGVGASSIAMVVRLKVTSVDRKIPPSSLPPSPLRPALPFYVRYEFILEAIDTILQKSEAKKHISIRGGPGMGKTATATGIIHHPRIARHFGKARHWVDCREVTDVPDDLKAPMLFEYISDSLGLHLTSSSDRRKDIEYFLNNNDVPRIVVLDNFETMWEPPNAQEASERVLQFLARFTQLTIILTTRNAHDPATHLGVSWHLSESIEPLSLEAARELFTSLSLKKYIDNRLDDLLCAVNRIPLPIVLMASSAQENYMTSEMLEAWNNGLSKRNVTQPHKDDSDPMNKLYHAIALSLQGPLIKSTPEAPMLLRIIADLPGGIRRKNLQRIVPLIRDADRVAAVLIRASLLINSPDTLQMHSTIRSHMIRNYALDASHEANVQAFYFRLIHEAGGDPGTQDFLERAHSLSHEETNAQALLLNILEHNFTISVPISMDYANYLIWNIPSVDVANKTVELLRNQPLRGETGNGRTAGRNLYWWWYQHQPPSTTDSLLPLALLRLGTLHFRLDHYPEAIKALEEAVDRYEKLNQLSCAAQARFQLAEIPRLQGKHTRALELYSEAYERFEDVEDARGMSACLRGKAIVYFQDNRTSEALETIMTAQKKCPPDDHTCIADCERELGRAYRYVNQTESIRLSTKARDYYLIHGPRRHAAIALYQKSIALYLQGDYEEAEVGLSEAYEESRSLRNDAQMGYCVFHRAEMNRMRGTRQQALELYRRSESMFEHMENKFMAGLSLKGQAELYAKLCQPDKAREAYSSALALLKNVDAKEAATHDIQNIDGMCDPTIRRDAIFSYLLLFLACVVLCLLLFLRRLKMFGL